MPPMVKYTDNPKTDAEKAVFWARSAAVAKAKANHLQRVYDATRQNHVQDKARTLKALRELQRAADKAEARTNLLLICNLFSLLLGLGLGISLS